MTARKKAPGPTYGRRVDPIRDYVMGSDNVRDSNQAIANAMRARRGEPRAKIRILVVDDDPDGLESTTKALRSVKFEVLQATDGKKALAVLESSPADLVIVNITVPEASGLEVISALRPLYPVTKVIAVARPDEPWCLRDAARKFGAVHVLAKPFASKDLLDSVRAALCTPPA